jgi:uncharacterized protein YwqG
MLESSVDSFRTKLIAQKLDGHLDTLLAASKEVAAMHPNSRADDQIPLGRSKLGGKPDLPVNYGWPLDAREHPLSFIIQINLSEIPAFAERGRLPANGLLSVFYNLEIWGFDPKDGHGFRVVYFDCDASALRRTAPPELPAKELLFGLLKREQKVKQFRACALNFEPALVLPDFADLKLEESLADPYYELLESLGCHHRLLGYAEPIQNPMELECEMVTNGLYTGDSRSYSDVRRNEFERSSRSWHLLMQIDTEVEQSDMMWGDGGRLYIWIKEDDLAARRFEKAWMISQCY